MKYLLALLLFIWVYFLLSNVYNFKRTKKLKIYHLDFLNGEKQDFSTYKSEVLSLFKKAKIKDSHFPVTQHVGYNYLAKITASVWATFPSKIEYVAVTIDSMFDEAIGYYRKNIFNSFNPLFLIEKVLFFPKAILDYLGLSPEHRSTKILNLLLTAFWWVFDIFLLAFNDKIIEIVHTTVTNFSDIFS